MGQVIGIDSSVLIFLIEEHPRFLEGAEKVMRDVQRGTCDAVLSAVGMIEVLTGPKRRGRRDMALQYREFIKKIPHLRILGINERVVDIASDLRALYLLRTPDAIHIATAISEGASAFVTHDRRLTRVKEIRVETLV